MGSAWDGRVAGGRASGTTGGSAELSRRVPEVRAGISLATGGLGMGEPPEVRVLPDGQLS